MRAEMICRSCGMKVLKKNLAETRKVYPSQEITYLCTPCKKRQLEDAIVEERKRLGLPPKDQGP